ADDHLGPAAAAAGMVAGQHAAGRIAQAQREAGIDDLAADLASHAVGSEIFALTHGRMAPCSTACQTFRASTVAATSCTRTIEAPRATQANAPAMLPARRSATGLPAAAPTMVVRESPVSSG